MGIIVAVYIRVMYYKVHVHCTLYSIGIKYYFMHIKKNFINYTIDITSIGRLVEYLI